jgi:hypothetical protein
LGEINLFYLENWIWYNHYNDSIINLSNLLHVRR